MFPFVLSQQQQLGRKDRILQQQQQKLEEAQQRAQEGSLGRVDERAFTNSEVRQKPGSQRRFAGETSVLLHNGTETKRHRLYIAATDMTLLNAAGQECVCV